METQLLEQIEQYLVRTHLSPTRFGRIVVSDPRFVEDLRAGRKPKQRTLERVSVYLMANGEVRESQAVTHETQIRV